MIGSAIDSLKHGPTAEAGCLARGHRCRVVLASPYEARVFNLSTPKSRRALGTSPARGPLCGERQALA